jgi:iron complex outermembrane recepter protein
VSLPRARLIALIMLMTAGSDRLQAQRDSSVTTLKPILVTVTRGSGRTILGSPFAISVVLPDSSRPGQRHTSIDETLALVPGVSSVSRSNPSQDPRLSIRGFGVRSAFGVRGVRVLRDGIPITLPDGQTPLDYLSLESVGNVEVLRGAASALYGNASGGVVDIRTSAPAAAPFSARAKQWLGPDDYSRTTLSASGTPGNAAYVGDVSYSRSDGSRAHSRQRSTTGFARAAFRAQGIEYSLTAMALNNPLAENPGALTLEEMRANPEQADALSVRRNARKEVKQIQLAASAVRSTSSTELSLSAFGGARSLDNPLTFAVVEIGRHTWGASASARTRRNLFGKDNSFAAGFDLQLLNDLRKNFAACADTIAATTPTPSCPYPPADRGIVTLAQRELVSSAGIYAGDDVELTDKLVLSAGMRGDRIRFKVEDHLVTDSNADDSGARTLAAVSPVIGLLARVTQSQSLYANVSSAFETPTATELGNHADGSAGINPDLDPQHSYTIEVGAKGWIRSIVRYDAALFDTRVRDELVPFEIPGSNGRRFFRNAGRTRRQGAELGGEISGGIASLLAAYSYSRFRFTQYESGGSDFSGNEIPGIARHRIQSALRFGRGESFALVENETSGRAFLDDANAAVASGYSVTGLRIGSSVSLSRMQVGVTGGIQNIFDRNFASSLAINAARGKYFEPAPGRTFYLGFSLGSVR